MLILPAIDLLEGRCVRLLRGDFTSATVYSEEPVALARQLVGAGARALHVVDLDGARAGHPVNGKIVAEIAAAAGVPVQVGGGVRSPADVDALLEWGAGRVLVGTAALTEPGWAADAVRRFGPERIVVAVDVRGNEVFVSGWTAGLARSLERVVEGLAEAGVTTLLVTDITRDGTLEGPNLDLYRRLARHPLKLVAAGGIAVADDLRTLAGIGLNGAVVGRALYEGTLALEELRELSSQLTPAAAGEEAPSCSPSA